MTRLPIRAPLAKLACALLSSALLLSGCSLLPAEEEALSPPVLQKEKTVYVTADVKRGELKRYITAGATAQSASTQSVAFPESGGRLKKLLVTEGQQVKTGDPIAELDTGDLPVRIKLAKLTVEQKEILLRKASDSNNEEAVRLAEIDLEREQLLLAGMEKEYKEALLTAPADGVILYVSELLPGRVVQGLETIATIADPDHLRLVYEATEAKAIEGAKTGMDAEIKLGKTSYKGKVVQAPDTAPKSEDDAVNRRNQKSLLLQLTDPSVKLKLGQFADITIFIEQKDNTLYIPRSALHNFLGRKYVQVYENERIKEIDVEVGITTGKEVEIVKGLTEGQKVILPS